MVRLSVIPNFTQLCDDDVIILNIYLNYISQTTETLEIFKEITASPKQTTC